MRILGIDGCRSGWLGILIDRNDKWEYLESRSIKSLILHFKPDVCLIDIPVVLSKKEAARECDIALRKLLPAKYTSSVFNPPVFNTLKAQNYKKACELNQDAVGKKISLQTWHIMPKIKEVNEFLDENNQFASKIYEAHPETFFFRLNNDIPLQHKKKTIEGRFERLGILNKLSTHSKEIYNSILFATLRKDVQYDDILDTIVLALAGFKYFPNMFEMLPIRPIMDEKSRLQNVFIPKKLPH